MKKIALLLFLGALSEIKFTDAHEYVELEAVDLQPEAVSNRVDAGAAEEHRNAEWVELPNCGRKDSGADGIPLKLDLSNAAIATCKNYRPQWNYRHGYQGRTNTWDKDQSHTEHTIPRVYDPANGQYNYYYDSGHVWTATQKTSDQWLKPSEHQVTQSREGTVADTLIGGPINPYSSKQAQNNAEAWAAPQHTYQYNYYRELESDDDDTSTANLKEKHRARSPSENELESETVHIHNDKNMAKVANRDN